MKLKNKIKLLKQLNKSFELFHLIPETQDLKNDIKIIINKLIKDIKNGIL